MAFRRWTKKPRVDVLLRAAAVGPLILAPVACDDEGEGSTSGSTTDNFPTDCHSEECETTDDFPNAGSSDTLPSTSSDPMTSTTDDFPTDCHGSCSTSSSGDTGGSSSGSGSGDTGGSSGSGSGSSSGGAGTSSTSG